MVNSPKTIRIQINLIDIISSHSGTIILSLCCFDYLIQNNSHVCRPAVGGQFDKSSLG